MDMIKIDSSNIAEFRFNSMTLTEDIYDNEYEYMCNYDISIKFQNIETGDRKLDEYINTRTFKDSKKLSKDYKDKRPEVLFETGALTVQDVEESKEVPEIIDNALQDFVDQNIKNKPGVLINLITDLFDYDIPNRVFSDIVYNNKMELEDTRKVKRVEYNYKKSSIKRMSIFYEDDEYITVNLKSEVTDKDVDNIIPNQSLASVYLSQEYWFEENYEKTLEILNSIFGFNLETLKGANVVW